MTRTKRLKMILTRDRKRKNNRKKKRRLGRIKTNRKWTKTKDKHRERKLGSKKLGAILRNPRQPLNKRIPRLWRSRREREWMWQRHFSADIAEKIVKSTHWLEIFMQGYSHKYTTYFWCYLKSFFSFPSYYTLVLSSSTSRFSDFPLKILLFFVRFVLKELIQTERDYVKSLGEVVEVSLVIFTLKRFGTNLQSMYSAFWHFLVLSFFPGILSWAR